MCLCVQVREDGTAKLWETGLKCWFCPYWFPDPTTLKIKSREAIGGPISKAAIKTMED
jgi:hypothetical protein